MNKLTALILAMSLGTAIFAAEKAPLNIRDFGAKGDGVTNDTGALQKALDACGASGGGTVIVPEGVYLTGSIILRANTTLQLAARANLLGSPDCRAPSG